MRNELFGDYIPAARNVELVIQELEDELLLYDLVHNKAFCLNSTSREVWGYCDGTRSAEDIAQLIGDQDVVWLALNELRSNHLLTNDLPSGKVLNGISRREAIKRIGLGSAAALPVILSMAAPTAAQTQSICGKQCGNDTACNSIGSVCPSCVGMLCTALPDDEITIEING
ncbi:MAG: hypothetical protein H0V76_06475 [Blastocatellia bacterium]|nr:hypothetical protein [Blastocatellia bacterium]